MATTELINNVRLDNLVTLVKWSEPQPIPKTEPETESLSRIKNHRLGQLVNAMISLPDDPMEKRQIIRAFIDVHFPKCITNKTMGRNLSIFFSDIKTNQPLKPTVARLLSTSERV